MANASSNPGEEGSLDTGFNGDILEIHPGRRVQDQAELSILLVRQLNGQLLAGAWARILFPSGRVRRIRLDGMASAIPSRYPRPLAVEASRLLNVLCTRLEPEIIASGARLLQNPGGDSPPLPARDATEEIADLWDEVQQHADVRYAAVQVLAALGVEAPITPLVRALDDENREVRWLAATALSHVGLRAPAELFLARIADKQTENQGVRRAAGPILAAHVAAQTAKGEPVDPALVAALRELLHDPNDATVLMETAGALAREAEHIPVELLVEAMERWTGSPTRAIVAAGLARHSDRAALAPLVAALDDPDFLTREQVAHVVLSLGERLSPAIRERAEQLVAQEAARHREMSDRERERLSGFHQNIEPPTREAYLAALRAPERERRVSALRLLGQINDPPFDAFVGALADEDANVRMVAAEVLGEVAQRIALDGQMAERIAGALVARLEDGSDDVESAAEQALLELAPQLPDALILSLEGAADWRTRHVAIQVLVQRGERAPLEGLLVAATFSDRYMREEALGGLRKSYPEVLVALSAEAQAILEDRPAGPMLERLVQVELAVLIGQRRLTSEAAVNTLGDLLEVPHPGVLRAAVWALGEMLTAAVPMSPRIIARLRELASDSTWRSVRDAAGELLTKVTS